jgi:hypothetical protein
METKVKKKFDAVQMMRNIRNKIDQELESMPPEQRREYYKKQREEFEEWKIAKR